MAKDITDEVSWQSDLNWRHDVVNKHIYLYIPRLYIYRHRRKHNLPSPSMGEVTIGQANERNLEPFLPRTTTSAVALCDLLCTHEYSPASDSFTPLITRSYGDRVRWRGNSGDMMNPLKILTCECAKYQESLVVVLVSQRSIKSLPTITAVLSGVTVNCPSHTAQRANCL